MTEDIDLVAEIWEHLSRLLGSSHERISRITRSRPTKKTRLSSCVVNYKPNFAKDNSYKDAASGASTFRFFVRLHAISQKSYLFQRPYENHQAVSKVPSLDPTPVAGRYHVAALFSL